MEGKEEGGMVGLTWEKRVRTRAKERDLPRQKKKCKRQDVLCECECARACVVSVA